MYLQSMPLQKDSTVMSGQDMRHAVHAQVHSKDISTAECWLSNDSQALKTAD